METSSTTNSSSLPVPQIIEPVDKLSDDNDRIVENTPEAKKTKKRVLTETTNEDPQTVVKRKLRLVDLVKGMLPSTSGARDLGGAWPFELILVRHGQSVSTAS
jgi:hypothetical protein